MTDVVPVTSEEDDSAMGFLGRASSRKFIHASFIQMTASALIWFGKMSESGFITISTMTLAIYCGASIVDKVKNPSQQP